MYGDIIDIITDSCSVDNAAEYIAYLANTTKVNDPYREWLIDNLRCPRCGSELRARYINEVHTELDGSPIEEVLADYICDYCGEVVD